MKDVVNDTITLTKETTDNTLETVTVNSSLEANTLADLQTTGVGATKLVITGDKALTLTAAVDTEVVTVDGSAATGAIQLTTGATADTHYYWLWS